MDEELAGLHRPGLASRKLPFGVAKEEVIPWEARKTLWEAALWVLMRPSRKLLAKLARKPSSQCC